jgi:hypothetical protein
MDRPLIAPNLNFPLISSAPMTGNIISTATIIQRIPGISYDIAWIGVPFGTFSVQVSNTYSQNPNGSVANVGNWNTIPSTLFVGTFPVAAGAPGNGMIDVVDTEVYAVRLVYTFVSGTGTLTVLVCGKVL